MSASAAWRGNRNLSPATPGVAPLLDIGGFDRRAGLLAWENKALSALSARELQRNRSVGIPRRTALHWRALARLLEPLDAARIVLHHGDDVRFRRAGLHAVAIVLGNCAAMGRTWWGWSSWDWARLAGASSAQFRAAQPLPTETTVRPFVVALGYLLGEFTEFQHLGAFNRLHLAQLIFGTAPVETAMGQVAEVTRRWGYRSQTREDGRYRLPGILAQALLINRSPELADLSTEAFARLHAHPANSGRQHTATLYALQRAVAEFGYCQPPVRPGFNHAPTILAGVPTIWADLLQRWYDTSTLTADVRANIRVNMAKAGRWLAAEHPEASDPRQWTRATCAAWVAAVDRMAVGDWVQRRDHLHERVGKPILPRTKAHMLMGTRTFFRDLQEWEWIPRRFDPTRALALPRSVAALIGTNPRVIADDVWAKLLWAGLNLQTQDLPGTSAGSYYPLALIRALALA